MYRTTIHTSDAKIVLIQQCIYAGE